MNCWSTLGVSSDADERTIRRSYAALLKVHRPDEDLDAFQRLREAYEQALAIARWHAQELDADDGANLVGQAVEPAPEPVDHQAHRLRIEASLRDLSHSNLESVATQARTDNQLVAFELSLLERCLADGEHGHAAAQWAINNLRWLSPWQEASLPSARMDVLFDRLLARALSELQQILGTGDEQGFLTRLGELFAREWLQQFDRRSRLSRDLVDVLLAAPRWSKALFQTVAARCLWSDDLAWRDGWLEQWKELQRRVELCNFYEEIDSYLTLDKPETSRAKATWLLFKPLSDQQRRRLVDSFEIPEWSMCEVIERKLKREAPEVFSMLAPHGATNWREWQRAAVQWPGVGISLWLLLSATTSLQLWDSDDSLIFVLARAGMASLVLVVVLLLAHRLWRLCTGWFLAADVQLSQWLLPASWVRNGKGILLSRHVLPSLFIGCVPVLTSMRADMTAILAGVVAGVLAFIYANFSVRVGPPLVVLGDYLYRFQAHWSKALWVAGGVCILVGTFWGVQHRDELRMEQRPLLQAHEKLLSTDKRCEELLEAVANRRPGEESMTKMRELLCRDPLRREASPEGQR